MRASRSRSRFGTNGITSPMGLRSRHSTKSTVRTSCQFVAAATGTWPDRSATVLTAWPRTPIVQVRCDILNCRHGGQRLRYVWRPGFAQTRNGIQNAGKLALTESRSIRKSEASAAADGFAGQLLSRPGVPGPASSSRFSAALTCSSKRSISARSFGPGSCSSRSNSCCFRASSFATVVIQDPRCRPRNCSDR